MRKIAESVTLTKYFLVMSFVFVSLVPEAVNLISLFTEKWGTFAGQLVGMFRLNFVLGFTGYFLPGYFLDRAELSRKAERVIYIAGILGGAVTVVISSLVSVAKNAPIETFYSNFTVNILCEAAAMFVFFRERLNFPARFIRSLSRYTFGAYLVHVLVIMVEDFGFNTLTFSPVISVPVISVIVFVISFTVSAILNNIPVLKKYIV